jgi:hypothetical protein
VPYVRQDRALCHAIAAQTIGDDALRPVSQTRQQSLEEPLL